MMIYICLISQYVYAEKVVKQCNSNTIREAIKQYTKCQFGHMIHLYFLFRYAFIIRNKICNILYSELTWCRQTMQEKAKKTTMKGRSKGVTGAQTCPSMKYNWIRGSDVAKFKLPGSIAFCLSCSVFTKNVFLRWNVINEDNLRISPAIPAHPSIIMYVMKNVAFMGIVLPTVFVNLQKLLIETSCQLLSISVPK